MTLSKKEKVISWICQVVAAIIMLQTLYFKFSGSEESVFIFSTLNIEPWGRFGTGIAELIASVLLLIPATCWLGALIGIGIMGGALVSHLTILGIEVKGDGGYLFFLGIIVLITCLIIVFIRRKEVPYLKNYQF